jgi:hypothetical protein
MMAKNSKKRLKIALHVTTSTPPSDAHNIFLFVQPVLSFESHAMPYTLLIVEDPHQRATRTEAEGHAVYDRMVRFSGQLQARGLLLATQSLTSQAAATRVTVRGGKPQVIDGPFAEAKEMVGGFFLLDCKTQAEAIAIAAECPAAEWCTVEVREVGPCFT